MDRIQEEAALLLQVEGISKIASRSTGEDFASTAETLSAVYDAGIFHLDDRALVLVGARALGRFCASTAWMLAEHDDARRLVQAFSPAVREATTQGLIVKARGAVSASLSADGRISGVWPSVGGLGHAEWLLLTGITDASGQQVAALVPAKSVRTQPYTYSGGLRGAGWQRVEIDGLLVSPEYCAQESDIRYLGSGPDRLVGALIGCAEGGVQEYVQMTRSRIAGVGGAAVAGFTQVQARLAESDSELGCAVRLYESILDRIGEGDSPQLRRDRAYMARLVLDSLTRLVRQMGAMGLLETNPVQRRYRDLRTLSADSAFAWDGHMAGYGRELLGIEEKEPVAAE